MNIYRLGACLKCRGDLVYDDGDWKCLQCGVYYYTGLYIDTTPHGKDNEGRVRIAGTPFPTVAADDGQLAPAAD